mmetsp:Transcript_10081/g.22296  ORF Transcript_10081/g.22296 Transcript_10081/m.22296 type:complete len:342 (+) Transcript_10081:449-1474(+)
MAKQAADSNSTKEVGLKVAAEGLKISKQPMKPPMLASQRSFATFSPRIVEAKAILKNGMVLLTTTQEAKGSNCKPEHQRPIPTARRKPRARCKISGVDDGDDDFLPVPGVAGFLETASLATRGAMTRAAARNRRKTICMAGRLPPRYFMMESFAMPTRKWPKYQVMPTIYCVLAPTLLVKDASPARSEAIAPRLCLDNEAAAAAGRREAKAKPRFKPRAKLPIVEFLSVLDDEEDAVAKPKLFLSPALDSLATLAWCPEVAASGAAENRALCRAEEDDDCREGVKIENDRQSVKDAAPSIKIRAAAAPPTVPVPVPATAWLVIRFSALAREEGISRDMEQH